MGSAKDEVGRILEQTPDNASFEDIQYHIYVREKIDRVSKTSSKAALSARKRRNAGCGKGPESSLD
jgi:hypothetical protein